MEPGSLLAPRVPCPVFCGVRGLPWVEALGAVPEAVPRLWPERVLLYFFPVCRFYSDNM